MSGYEDFWIFRKGWPGDTASHVFLGSAVNELGKALFGSSWTGAEPATRLMPFSNSQIERSSTFREEVDRDRAAKRPAMDRFARVKATIIRLAETEQLATALRSVDGGDPVPIHRSLWNSERLDVRFHSCQMNPRKPFYNGIAGDGYGLIFVTRESLEKCISALAAAPQGVEATAPAPPKMAATAKAPSQRVTPKGFHALERAVLLIARELDQSLWNHGKMTLAEINLYERLGETTHYKDLRATLAGIETNLRDRKTGALPDGLIEARFDAYRAGQKLVQAALQAGELRSFLLMADTGERLERDASTWISESAPNWFDDGYLVDEPNGVSGSILIDEDSFSDWYYSASGPMGDIEAKEKDKGGRPPEYDWDAIKAYTLGLVREHGLPGRHNRRLPSKSQLVEAVLDEWSRRNDQQLAESTVRRHVGRWLGEL